MPTEDKLVDRFTTAPPTNAGLFSDAVQFVASPMTAIAGLQLKPVRIGAVIRLRLKETDRSLSDAVMAPLALVPTAPAEISNEPVEDPVGTDTDEGTANAATLLLKETATAASAVGAIVTLQLAVPWLVRLFGEHDSADMNDAGERLTEVTFATPLEETVIATTWLVTEGEASPLKEALVDPAGMVKLAGRVSPEPLLEIATMKPADGATAEIVTWQVRLPGV